jgi:glycosyltransferase involved in cell wall biosynthesis
MRILHLMSCRGWSSDAYWAARMSQELARRGHEVTLGCRAGTETRVIDRVRGEGVERVVTLALASGVKPAADLADLRRLRTWHARSDVVHVHRGKEHWLAALANRLSSKPRPLVRTRHIAQAVRPHAANRWLYGRATHLVITVTEAIRRQYLATGLVSPERVIALPGGVNADRYPSRPADPEVRRRLGAAPGELLVGLVGGLRVMKGHRVVVEAASRLAPEHWPLHFAVVGQGSQEDALRDALQRARLEGRFTVAGFAPDLPAVLNALDIALYVPLESDGMSRIVWEYLAAGRPLIASRVGAVAETLVDSEHALLVHAGDAGALASALRRLAGDSDLRQRLGQAGRCLVGARYSGARVAAALEEHYRRLIS